MTIDKRWKSCPNCVQGGDLGNAQREDILPGKCSLTLQKKINPNRESQKGGAGQQRPMLWRTGPRGESPHTSSEIHIEGHNNGLKKYEAYYCAKISEERDFRLDCDRKNCSLSSFKFELCPAQPRICAQVFTSWVRQFSVSVSVSRDFGLLVADIFSKWISQTTVEKEVELKFSALE